MSKKIKTIIVDDERLARKELKKLLQNHSSIEVIDDAANAQEALEKIESQKPDLIFLDIQMPEKTGFDLLEDLTYIPEVIFVTAYDEYAIKAFEVNAFDYILKPVDPQRLEQAIIKLNIPETTNTKQTILSGEDQIFLKDGDKCWFVKLSDIRFFESEGNYVKVFFNDNKPLILKSLNNIEQRLNSKEFFRTSRKHIANLNWIEKVDPWFSNTLKLTLKTGEEIEVSRRQTQKFKEMMGL